jgi:hypothetical protein
VGRVAVGANWVRFAFLDRPQVRVGVNWVRFAKTAFGCWRLAFGRAGIGFVSQKQLLAVGFWRLAGGELGSFRVFVLWGDPRLEDRA